MEKQISKEQIVNVMNGIIDLLEKEGVPLDSIDIKFKNVENPSSDKKIEEGSAYIIEPKFKCHFCGGGGMLGVCCEF